MKMKIPKEYQPLVKAARAQGWTIEHTRKNHLAWISPAGRTTFTPGTPGDNWGGHMRVLSKLRRAGLVLPG